MKRLMDTVQKRIGFLISIVGLAVVMSNFFRRFFTQRVFFLRLDRRDGLDCVPFHCALQPVPLVAGRHFF